MAAEDVLLIVLDVIITVMVVLNIRIYLRVRKTKREIQAKIAAMVQEIPSAQTVKVMPMYTILVDNVLDKEGQFGVWSVDVSPQGRVLGKCLHHTDKRVEALVYIKNLGYKGGSAPLNSTLFTSKFKEDVLQDVLSEHRTELNYGQVRVFFKTQRLSVVEVPPL